jgi:hypothetical protein
MFRFKPYTEEQINNAGLEVLLPNGDYPFQVLNIVPKQSKSGNNMLELKLQLHTATGLHTIQDWLVDSPDLPKMAFKLRHFCDTIGLQVEYLQGEFAPSAALNRRGHLKLGRERGKLKADGQSSYPDRNVVRDYLKKVPRQDSKELGNTPPLLNDEIPF